MSSLQTNEQKKSIEPGDIFELGEHRLICGDAKDPEIVKKLVGDNKVRMILTDPPYGVAYVENKRGVKNLQSKEGDKTMVSVDREIIGDHAQTDEEYSEFTKKWVDIVIPYLASYNSFLIFTCDAMMCSFREGLKKAGLYYSQMIVWIKGSPVLGWKDYLPQHELIAFGWYGRHKMERSKGKTVMFHPKPSKSKLHPTMKPIGLLRKLILQNTKIKELIYDPFGGSGSTLIACEQTKRKCLMIELDPHYVEVIINRYKRYMENVKDKGAKGENGGKYETTSANLRDDDGSSGAILRDNELKE